MTVMYAGTQKAASSWLHRALEASRLSVAPRKEWHYWDRVLGFATPIEQLVREHGRPLRFDEFLAAHTDVQPDREARLGEIPAVPRTSIGSEARLRPFRDPRRLRGLLAPRSALEQWASILNRWDVGDFTPSNVVLSSDQWSEISESLPELKVIIGIRNPTARVWSAIRMYQRLNWIDRVPDPDEAVEFVDVTGMKERSFVSRTVANVLRAFATEQVLLVALDDVHETPERVLARLEAFVGCHVPAVPAANVGKAQTLPPALQERLDAHFSIELARLEQLAGRELRA